MASQLSSSPSILSRKILPAEHAQRLLKKKIQLQMFISSEEVIGVATDVEQVYKACKKTLEEYYGPVELAIRGSSVAGLFSLETAHDLDLQARFSFNHVKARGKITDTGEATREGYNLRWKLLESLRELFLKHVSQEKHALIRSISLDAFRFKDTNVLSGNLSQGPCNIHQLQVGEIEISCFVEIDSSKPPQRNFDFNSGALEVIINDKGQAVMQSPLDDIDGTIREITAKELRCVKPQELSRRALTRYFSKLVFSGYFDPSPDLFSSLIEVTKTQHKKEDPFSLAQELLKELQHAFKDKKSPLWILHLALWQTPEGHLLKQEIAKQVKEPLLQFFSHSSNTVSQYLKKCVESDNREALAWFFLMQASSIEVKMHQGEPHVHAHILSPTPWNVLIPVARFHQQIPLACIDVFFSDFFRVPLDKELSRETKEFLQKALLKQVKYPHFFPLLQGLSKKFSFKAQPAFVELCCKWMEATSLENLQKLEFEMIKDLLPMFSQEQLSLNPKCAFLKMMKRHLEAKNLSCFDKSVNPQFIIFCCNSLLRSQELKLLSTADQQEVIGLTHKLHKDFFCARDFEKEWLKPILNFTVLLQKKGVISWEEITQVAQVCFENRCFEECSKLWSLILTKGPQIHQEPVLKALNNWCRFDPKKFLSFLAAHREELIKIEGFLETCLQQNHLNCIEQLDVEKFPSYCELLEKIGQPKLFVELAKTSQFRLLQGCRNTFYYTTFLREQLHVAVVDLVHVHDLDAKVLEKIIEIPFVRAALETDESFTRNVFNRALAVKTLALAKQQIENVLQRNSLAALQMLAEISFEDLQTFSLKDLINYANCLHASCSFEEHQQMRILIERILNLFDPRCEVLLQDIASFADKQQLQSFHKKFMLDTYEHPAWAKVWTALPFQYKENQLHQWVDQERMLAKLDTLSMIQMKPLLFHVQVSMEFLEKYTENIYNILKKASPGEHNYLQSMLFNFAERTNGAFWDLDVRAYRHNEIAMELFRAFFGYLLGLEAQNLELDQHMNLLLISLRGMSLFCSKEQRDSEIVSLFVEIMETHATSHLTFFKENGRFQLFILSLLQKAFQEKDLEQSEQLYCLYRQYCSPDVTQQTLVKQQDSLADLSIGAIEVMCRDTLRLIDSFTFSQDEKRKKESTVVNFYNAFLADMVVTFEEALSVVEQANKPPLQAKRQRILGFIKDQMERTVKACVVDNLIAMKHLFKYKPLLSKEIKLEISKKLFKVTCDLAQKKKNLASSEDAKAVICLTDQLREWLDHEDLLTNALEKEIVDLLESIRPLLFVSSRYHFVDQPLVYFIRSLEASLSQEVLEEHVFKWADSIAGRQETVTLQELNCFSILTLRLDARFNKIFARDPMTQRLHKKTIDFDKFFLEKRKIEVFIRVFGIAFRRFGAGLPEVQRYESEESLNIFSLFAIINPFIRKAIPLLKLVTDKQALVSMLLDTLMPQLSERANFLTKPVLAASWNCLFITERNPRAGDRVGKLKFRFLEKDSRPRNCVAFYQLSKKVAELAEEYKAQMGFDPKVLSDLFSFYYDDLSAHLSQVQLEELLKIFCKQLAPAEAAFVAAQGAAGGPAARAQEPERPLSSAGILSGLLDWLPSIGSSADGQVANPGAAATAAVNLLAQGMELWSLDAD